MPWYTHAPTFADPDTGAFSEDFKGIVENFPAMARGENGSPYVDAGWHPYDGLTVGDGADGVIYDFAVDGALASVETPSFADGYEYLIVGRGMSGSVTSAFRLEWYKETSASYSGVYVFSSGGAGDVVDFRIEAISPRAVSRIMFYDVKEANNGMGGEMDALIDSNRRLDMSTAQKVGKAKIYLASGAIDAGKIYMFKRRCFV